MIRDRHTADEVVEVGVSWCVGERGEDVQICLACGARVECLMEVRQRSYSLRVCETCDLMALRNPPSR